MRSLRRRPHRLLRAIPLRAVLVVLVVLLAVAMTALGAEPTLPSNGVIEGGDPRSEGQGPGLVGSPLAILAGVAVLGLATALLTVLAVRLTGRD